MAEQKYSSAAATDKCVFTVCTLYLVVATALVPHKSLKILKEYSSPLRLNSIFSLKFASLCSHPPWSIFFGLTVTNQCSPWPKSEQNFIIMFANWYKSGPVLKYYTALSLNILISSAENPCISITFSA